MGKAIGLGGVFIQFKGNEQEVKDWYQKMLKLDMSEYGTGFTSGEQLMILTFSKSDSQSSMLNFRVDDITSIVNDLKQENVTIISDITEYPYGKFATFSDPFSNVIELWEANEEEYKKMVLSEIEKYKKTHLN